jgi:hypothetical protein
MKDEQMGKAKKIWHKNTKARTGGYRERAL